MNRSTIGATRSRGNMGILNTCWLWTALLTMLVFCVQPSGSQSMANPHSRLNNTIGGLIRQGHQQSTVKTVKKTVTSRRMLVAQCTSRDISISQSRDDTPGIPQFIVQIINTCTAGCTPSDIHLNCGWFASAGTINPRIFRRVAYNDCLVNGGGPLPREGIVRFTYRNSFMYPLSFKSAKFCS